jgi:hypothetical protein
MIPVIILFLFVLFFFAFLGYEGWRRYSDHDKPVSAGPLTAVDLDAFENLIDPEEDQYLRVELSPSEFRDVQRARIQAAMVYVAALSRNAHRLVEVGQSARYHTNPEVAAAGAEIVQRALRLKLWCLLAFVRLNAANLFPNVLTPSSRIANQYLLVTYMATSVQTKIIAT